MAKRVSRTRCSGRWTESRFRSFVMSALRQASVKWRPKQDALKKSFIEHGVNPQTGHKCKLHECARCRGLFKQGDLRADHIEPVIDPYVGFEGWDKVIDRMFVEAHGFQALCEDCHTIKTKRENWVRNRVRFGKPVNRVRKARK